MFNKHSHKTLLSISAAMAVYGGLYLTSLYSFLLFHNMVEFATVAVAAGMFILAWNSRRYASDHFLLFLGVAFPFIAVLDLLHTLSYKGMGVFPGYGANLPTQLWIAARYMQALSFLAAPVFLTRRLHPGRVMAVYSLLLALTLAGIFSWRLFPDCYIEGVGLTPFKIISEYVICAMSLAAIGLYLKMKNRFHPSVLRLLIISLSLTIAAELAFTFYVSVYDLSNLFGHFFKLAAYYTIYRAIIRFSLNQPFELLYRDLKQRDEDFIESQKRVKAIYQNMPFPVFIWQAENGDINLVDYNLAAQKSNPKSLLALLGKSAREIYSKRPDIVEYLERCLKENKPIRRETDYVMPGVDEKRRLVLTCSFIPPNLLMVHVEDITERKRYEEALKESEARYNAIFSNNPVPSYLWKRTDGDFKLVRFNKSVENGTAEKALKYKGRLASEILAEIPSFRDDLDRCYRERTVVRRESDFTSPYTGKKVHGVRIVAPIDQDFVLSIFQDTTELKQKEEDLEQSRKKLKSLFRGGPLSTLIYQAEGDDFVLIDFNRVTEKSTNGNIRQHVGRRAGQLYKDHPAILESMKKCFNEKTIIQLEQPYRTLSSENEFEAKMTFGFVEPDIVIVHFEDISERKSYEEALRESEARYNAIFNNNPAPSYLWQRTDGDFKLVHFNKNAEIYSEGNIHNYKGNLASDIFAKTPHIKEDMDKCYEKRTVVHREGEFADPCSDKKFHGVRIVAPIDQDFVLSIFQDTTELKQKEEALRQSEERLKSLFQGSPLPTLIYRAEGDDFVMIDFNQETDRRTDGKIRQYLNSLACDLYKDSPPMLEGLRKCLREKVIVHEEFKYKSIITGHRFDASMTFGFVAPDTIILQMEDISQRKKAEKELKESEARYNSLFFNNPVPCYLWQRTDGDFKLVHFNKSAEIFSEGNISKHNGPLAGDIFAEMPYVKEDMDKCYEKRTVVRREHGFIDKYTGKKIYACGP